MEEKKLIEFIKKMSEAKGAPGFEDEITKLIKEEAVDFKVETDPLKNTYIGFDENKESLVMLDAHSDEVGFIVRFIDEKGLISFLPLGGWFEANIPAHLVWVRGKEGKYYKGIVTAKPIHFMTPEERKRLPEIEELRIDLGYSREEIIEKLGIGVGSPIVPCVDFEYNEDNRMMLGKAFDNRLGACAVVETMKALKKEGLDSLVTGTVASQEEVGCRGAKLTGRKVKAKYAIIFEGSPSDDGFVDSKLKIQCGIKNGPQVRHYDGAYISDEYLIGIAEEVSKELGIEIQHAVRKGSATNASAIHLENQGIRCLVIGIPSRYIHTHYSYASLDDFEKSVKLASNVIKRLVKEEKI